MREFTDKEKIIRGEIFYQTLIVSGITLTICLIINILFASSYSRSAFHLEEIDTFMLVLFIGGFFCTAKLLWEDVYSQKLTLFSVIWGFVFPVFFLWLNWEKDKVIFEENHFSSFFRTAFMCFILIVFSIYQLYIYKTKNT